MHASTDYRQVAHRLLCLDTGLTANESLRQLGGTFKLILDVVQFDSGYDTTVQRIGRLIAPCLTCYCYFVRQDTRKRCCMHVATLWSATPSRKLANFAIKVSIDSFLGYYSTPLLSCCCGYPILGKRMDNDDEDKRYKVVTLDGTLIHKSGNMTGGRANCVVRCSCPCAAG